VTLICSRYGLIDKPFCRFLIASLLGLVALNAAAQTPLEYDARLCSAGIVVLGADIGRLRAASASDHELNWLQQRVQGNMGTLGWLCRRYAALHSIEQKLLRHDIDALREAVTRKDWAAAAELLLALDPKLSEDVEIPDLVQVPAEILDDGESIYTRYCHGCHVVSNPRQTPPVYSLAGMANNLPAREFIARMITGVHGTAEIALRNPLSDDDIRGIYAYLLTLPAD